MKLRKTKVSIEDTSYRICVFLKNKNGRRIRIDKMKFNRVTPICHYFVSFRNKDGILWTGSDTRTCPKMMAKKLLEAFQKL